MRFYSRLTCHWGCKEGDCVDGSGDDGDLVVVEPDVEHL